MGELTPLDVHGIAIGLLGVLVAIGLWWIYFDLVSHRAPVSRRTQLIAATATLVDPSWYSP